MSDTTNTRVARAHPPLSVPPSPRSSREATPSSGKSGSSVLASPCQSGIGPNSDELGPIGSEFETNNPRMSQHVEEVVHDGQLAVHRLHQLAAHPLLGLRLAFYVSKPLYTQLRSKRQALRKNSVS